jgi:hypothetical protein
MAYDPKRVVVFGAAGLLLSALLITAFQFMPASILPDVPVIPDVPTELAKGLLIIKVRDKPVAELKELWIKVDEVRVHRVTEEDDGESPWIEDVLLIKDESFDLLALTTDDLAEYIAAAELPAGDYTEIRLHIYNNPDDPEDPDNPYAVIEEDGVPSEVPLRVVANGWLKVKIRFTLEEEEVTTVIVDIQVQEKSIVNSKKLHPVVKAKVEGVETAELIQTQYMWVDNDDAEEPTPLADENTPLEDVSTTVEGLRLRLAILNDGKAPWSGDALRLQFTDDDPSDSAAVWIDVGGTEKWVYSDGLGTDGNAVAELLLFESTLEEHFVESSPTEIIVDLPKDDQGEWDICIESNGADSDTEYFFRFVLEDGSPLDRYDEYPTLTTEAT